MSKKRVFRSKSKLKHGQLKGYTPPSGFRPATQWARSLAVTGMDEKDGQKIKDELVKLAERLER